MIWKDSSVIRSSKIKYILSSQYGKLKSSIKSDLFSYLSQEEWTSASTKVYYRNMFKPHPGHSETFQEYRETIFLPYIINQLRNVKRMDVVCGSDISPSALKILRGAREERIAVEASDRTPGSLEIGQPP